MFDRPSGLVLMEDRPDLKPGSEHYWVFPGGKVEDGEDWLTAMQRECHEELGVDAVGGRLLCDPATQPLRTRPAPGTKQHSKAPEGWRTVPFLVDRWLGQIPRHTNDDNCAPLAWFDPVDIAVGEPDGFTCNVMIARLVIIGVG